MDATFPNISFGQRLSSMVKVDFRRMFTQRLLWILLGICLVIPILILVMTTAVDGSSDAAGAGMIFTDVWQIIGSRSGGGAGLTMDMTSMCSINLLYFAAAVFVAIFVSEDFKSGYAKNLFTVRAKRMEYVISKILACFVGCALMLLVFFVGAMLGGAIAGLSFALEGLTVGNLVLCMLAKIFLMPFFVGIYLMMSLVAKQKTWLAMVGSFIVGMLMFMMIPSLTPLDASIVHAGMCLVGGAIFAVALGAASSLLLKRRDLL